MVLNYNSRIPKHEFEYLRVTQRYKFREISELYNIPTTTLIRIAKKYKIEIVNTHEIGLNQYEFEFRDLHFNQKYTLIEIAKLYSVSISKMSQTFKSIGLKYVNHLEINISKELLTQYHHVEKLTLAEIAKNTIAIPAQFVICFTKRVLR